MQALHSLRLLIIAESSLMDHQVTIFRLSGEVTRRTGVSRIAHLEFSILDDDAEGLRTMNDPDWFEGLKTMFC